MLALIAKDGMLPTDNVSAAQGLRMRQYAFLFLVVGPAVVCMPAEASSAELLCRREEVIEIVRKTVRTLEFYATPDLDTILEAPTNDPNTVRCIVRARQYSRNSVLLKIDNNYFYQVHVKGNFFTIKFEGECPVDAVSSSVCTYQSVNFNPALR